MSTVQQTGVYGEENFAESVFQNCSEEIFPRNPMMYRAAPSSQQSENKNTTLNGEFFAWSILIDQYFS
jgi:hypothetical protein